MTPEEIMQALVRTDIVESPFPEQALLAASSQRDEMLPLFLAEIDRFCRAPLKNDEGKSPIFYIFFLLGEFRDPVAYRPLVRLARHPEFTDRLGFADAFDDLGHLVMISVFDGDPQPLYDLVLNRRAHAVCRSNMLAVIEQLAKAGKIERESIANFLIDAPEKFKNNTFLWGRWAYTIAELQLSALRPIVMRAIEDDRFDGYEIKEFDETLAEAADADDEEELDYFGNACEELASYRKARGIE